MPLKILVTRPLSPDLLERLRGYFDVEVNEGSKYTGAQLKEALRGKDGVLVAGGERIDADLLSGLSGLRAVCVSAAGYNNVDVPALTSLGVIVTNAPGPADETVADFTWGSLIAVARKLTEAERWVREGQWKGPAGSRFFGTDVHGRVLGIIGMGRIGQAIARRAIAFNMEILYHNRHRLRATVEQEYRAVFVSKEELLGRADFCRPCAALCSRQSSYHWRGSVAADAAFCIPYQYRPRRAYRRGGAGRSVEAAKDRRRRAGCFRRGARHPSRADRLAQCTADPSYRRRHAGDAAWPCRHGGGQSYCRARVGPGCRPAGGDPQSGIVIE